MMSPLVRYFIVAVTAVIVTGGTAGFLSTTDGETTGAEALIMLAVTLVSLAAILIAARLGPRE